MKPAMIKNWVIWFVGLPLTVAGSVAAGVVLGDIIGKQPETITSQPLETEIQEEVEPISQPDPSQLIIGKWEYAGRNDSISETVPQILRATIEYFEDGTYQRKTEGSPPVFDPTTTNGTYVVLSDGRLKTTYEYCGSSPCQTHVGTNQINFPDKDTLNIYFTNGGWDIYVRQLTAPASEDI